MKGHCSINQCLHFLVLHVGKHVLEAVRFMPFVTIRDILTFHWTQREPFKRQTPTWYFDMCIFLASWQINTLNYF